ncbi:hypothetical protein [Nocardia huaxiensis]|uniref:hypothetical protein n=1 Tax=Nocardia huaxiensis TaxID=2755382 RepID=UPI001E406CA7|nr:hypothetical protein [Nocardia huaxiensis]UFS95338.1 hypothetical protein LPY97_32405 [Nocardia huaxiensis]
MVAFADGGSKRRRLLVIVAVFAVFFGPVMVAASFENTRITLTGENVTARVTECRYVNPRRGSSYYSCTGTWTLRNGVEGSGKLRGLERKLAPGTSVTARAGKHLALVDFGHKAPLMLGAGILVTTISTAYVIAFFRYRRARDTTPA